MEIRFITPPLTGREAVIVPASGKTRRQITAQVWDDKKLLNVIPDIKLVHDVKGVWLVQDMLFISAQVQQSVFITLRAVFENVTADFTVELQKDCSLTDAPPSPLKKDGWTLVYHDEFDGETLDPRVWSSYYLRGWTQDAQAKAEYFLEDGNLILTSGADRQPWCAQDGAHRVSSIQTFERTHLHRFGTVTGARNLSDFDGFATKYGYFELRARLPDTKDGSHFAWWMIGVQDDQHITATVDGELYPCGVYSNQTAEFDIIEQTLDPYHTNPDYSVNVWRPVIHPNGSADLKYLWVEPTPITHSAANEFHVYGFEWDETGTRFYLDGRMVKETDRTPNYRMMTLISLYGGTKDGSCGMGVDRGIYPKDAVIDYFRVYKRIAPPRPASVVLNAGRTPSYLRIPESGTSAYPMSAQVLSQFDLPMTAEISWQLSADIHGTQALSCAQMAEIGVTIDAANGTIVVSAAAKTNTELFVTAKHSEKVFAVKHVKLSDLPAAAQTIAFVDSPQKALRGKNTVLRAAVFDQYGKETTAKIHYQLSADITGNEEFHCAYGAMDENGVLTVNENAPQRLCLIATAHTDLPQGKLCCSCVLCVE